MDKWQYVHDISNISIGVDGMQVTAEERSLDCCFDFVGHCVHLHFARLFCLGLVIETRVFVTSALPFFYFAGRNVLRLVERRPITADINHRADDEEESDGTADDDAGNGTAVKSA